MRRLTILVLAGLIATGLSTPFANAATTQTGPLHTSGNKVYDAAGAEVRLRGITRDGLESSPKASNVSDYEFQMARQWGANVIRVPLSEDYWTALCPATSYDRSYPTTVDNVVQSITSRGMVALLELNYNPRFTCDPQANGPKKMADYPGSVVFWNGVANRYKDNPLVAFDLYNEPHDISDSIWLNGGTISGGGITWQAAGMQQLYDTIRKTGAQNLVFVSGVGWASEPPNSLVSGDNIVYAAHVYTCPHNPPPNCTTNKQVGLISVSTPVANPYDPTPILDRWTTLASTQPVMVTEFGWPSANSGTYNANVIGAAEQLGLGWIAYAWNGSTVGKFRLLMNAGPGAPYDPSPAGVPVKNALTTLP